MSKFFIKRLVLITKEGDKTIVDFKDGLNIIAGPVNTGKSLLAECINYMLCGKINNIHNINKIKRNYSYERMILYISTSRGEISLTRNIGSDITTIDSSDEYIKSDNYSSDSMDVVFLKLLGIEGSNKVRTSNESFNVKELSWRNILHLFLINDKDIDRDNSPLLSPQSQLKTESLSSLIYLALGVNSNYLEGCQDMYILDGNVKKYIKNKIGYISKEIENLKVQYSNINTESADKRSGQEKIEELASESQEIIINLYNESEHLTECITLKKSFKKLKQTYQNDIKRIQFVTDGIKAVGAQEGGKDNKLVNEELLINSKEELRNIEYHLSSLNEVIDELEDREQQIYERIIGLKEKLVFLRSLTTSMLQADNSYIYNKIFFLVEQRNKLNYELANIKKMEPSDVYREINNELPNYISKKIEYIFEKIWQHWDVKFKKDYFDIELGGEPKSVFMNGGLNSILNMLTLLVLHLYLMEQERPTPGFLIFDSALTRISDKINEDIIKEIRSGILKYLINHNLPDRQIILFERTETIPEEYRDVKGVNYIKFTGSKIKGQYGFLNGVEKS